MPLSRREFLTSLAGVRAAKPPEPLIAPGERLFRVYTRPPDLRVEFWSLSIGGMTRHPLSLSYDDLLALPSREIACTIVCAANPPGGERIGHARWTGVPLALLLDELTVDSRVAYARLEAADGHRTVVRYSDLRRGLVAYGMNGERLAAEHGFPARLIIPGLVDHKQPRWIERIELWDTPGDGGLWEQRGWSLSGEAPTVAAITDPHPLQIVGTPVRLAGYAFAGLRDIATVELSVDGGPWTPVPFEPGEPGSWVRWQVEWPAPEPGDYQISVRAIDINGTLQPPDRIHRQTVRVRAGRDL